MNDVKQKLQDQYGMPINKQKIQVCVIQLELNTQFIVVGLLCYQRAFMFILGPLTAADGGCRFDKQQLRGLLQPDGPVTTLSGLQDSWWSQIEL